MQQLQEEATDCIDDKDHRRHDFYEQINDRGVGQRHFF